MCVSSCDTETCSASRASCSERTFAIVMSCFSFVMGGAAREDPVVNEDGVSAGPAGAGSSSAGR